MVSVSTFTMNTLNQIILKIQLIKRRHLFFNRNFQKFLKKNFVVENYLRMPDEHKLINNLSQFVYEKIKNIFIFIIANYSISFFHELTNYYFLIIDRNI